MQEALNETLEEYTTVFVSLDIALSKNSWVSLPKDNSKILLSLIHCSQRGSLESTW